MKPFLSDGARNRRRTWPVNPDNPLEGAPAYMTIIIDPDERTIEAEPQGGHWIAGLVALVLIAIGTAGLVLIAIRIWRIML